MPWDIRRDLHIDIDASYGRFLLTSATDSSLRQPPPDFILGDSMPVRFHFWTRNPDGTLTVADPVATTTFRFSGRPAGAPTGSDLLFLTTTFTQISAGVWEGTLNLATTEFADHLAATPVGAKVILGELEIRDATNTKRNSFQFDLTARPQVYDNEDTPLGLPTPEEWLGDTLIGSTAPSNTTVTGVAATATITLTAVPAAGGTVTIGGQQYYLAPSGPATSTDVSEPWPTINATTWAAAIAGRINAWIGGGADPNVSATSSAGVVTITARSTGTTGNSITLAESATNLTVSGANLTGGVTAVSPTVAPPYLRTAGGFLYIQEAGVWKKAALSAL